MGEIFEIDDDMLSMLDILEVAPVLYERRAIEVEVLCDDDDGSFPVNKTLPADTKSMDTTDSPIPQPRTMQCQAYMVSKFNPTFLDLPYLEEFTCPWATMEECQKFMDDQNCTRHKYYEIILQTNGTEPGEAKRLASEWLEKYDLKKKALRSAT